MAASSSDSAIVFGGGREVGKCWLEEGSGGEEEGEGGERGGE